MYSLEADKGLSFFFFESWQIGDGGIFFLLLFFFWGHEGDVENQLGFYLFGYQQPATHGTRTCSLLTRLSSGSYHQSPQANNYHWLSSNNSKLKGYSTQQQQQRCEKRKQELPRENIDFFKRKKRERILISYYITIYSSSSTAAMVEPPPSTHVFVLVAPFGGFREEEDTDTILWMYKKKSGSGCVVSREEPRANEREQRGAQSTAGRRRNNPSFLTQKWL